MKLTVWRPPHRIGQTQCKHVRWNFRRRNNDIRCPLGIDLCIERNGWQWWWPMLIMFNIQWKQMKNKKTENELLWYYSRHKLGFGGGADMWGVCTEWVPVCPGSHDGCNSGVGGDNKDNKSNKTNQESAGTTHQYTWYIDSIRLLSGLFWDKTIHTGILFMQKQTEHTWIVWRRKGAVFVHSAVEDKATN